MNLRRPFVRPASMRRCLRKRALCRVSIWPTHPTTTRRTGPFPRACASDENWPNLHVRPRGERELAKPLAPMRQIGLFLLSGGFAALLNYGSRFVFSNWMPFELAVVAAY